LVDKNGVPLSIVIIKAANIYTKRWPPPTKKKKQQQQNLCLDKEYNYPEIEQEVVKRGYVTHIRQRDVKRKRSVKN
jgi:hypothetical protein